MIYIVVRRTTDWSDEATVHAHLRERFRPYFELWEATFTMPYRLFRLELSRIAHRSWSRVDGAAHAALADVPTGAVVLPTDDDDWYAPDVARTIASHTSDGHVGWYWRSEFLEVPISPRYELTWMRRALFPYGGRWLCSTNNYAVALAPGAMPLIGNHTVASRWFVAHPTQVMRLRPSLSVMNRSLASITSLNVKGAPMSKAIVLRKFRRYQRLYRRPIPPRFAWCAPYVAEMRALMDALEPR